MAAEPAGEREGSDDSRIDTADEGDPDDLAAQLQVAPYDSDDDLVEAVRAGWGAQLRIYTPAEPMVVLGRGSKLAEINVEACLADRVPVRRRRGGGCAVVIDPGNAVIATALPLAGYGHNLRYIRALSHWILEGLARVGARELAVNGICDLTAQGRKVCGACIYRSRGLLFYSATLPVDARLELLDRYLAHPPREPDYRAGRSHAEFVSRLQIPGLDTAAKLVEALRPALRVAQL